MASTPTVATANSSRKRGASKAPAISGVSASIAALAMSAGFNQFKDSKAASSFIDDTISLYAEVGERMHVAAIAAAWHAVTHRNPALLNRLYSALRSNDQMALVIWLKRVQIVHGLVLLGALQADAALPTSKNNGVPFREDQITAAIEAGAVLKFENKQFSVISDTSKIGDTLAHLIVARWFEPNQNIGESKVFVRNNVAAISEFDDADALKRIVAALSPKETGRRTLKLSPNVLKLMEKLKDQVEPMLKQIQSQGELAAGKH